MAKLVLVPNENPNPDNSPGLSENLVGYPLPSSKDCSCSIPNPKGCSISPKSYHKSAPKPCKTKPKPKIIPNNTPNNIITFQSNGKNPGHAYLLSTKYNQVDNCFYSLVQFEGDLVVELNGTEHKDSANVTKIILIQHNNKTATIFELSDLTYRPLGPIISDLSVGCSLAVSFNFTGRILFEGGENTHPNAFAVFRLDLKGNITKIHFAAGVSNLGVDLTPEDNLYVSGTGVTVAFLNKKRHLGEGEVNYFVGFINSDNEIVWSNLGGGGDIPIVDLTKASGIRGSELNQNGNGNLLVTGSFRKEITLDQKHTGTEFTQFWWGEINSDGDWVRSEVITGGNNLNDFIGGNSITSNKTRVYVTGTFMGSYSSGECNQKQSISHTICPSVFYGSAPNSCDGSIDTLNQLNANLSLPDQLQHHPRLVNVNGRIWLYNYYDTTFEHLRCRFISKGSLNMLVTDVSNNTQPQYIHIEGYEVNYNNDVGTGNKTLIIGGGSSLGLNKTNSYLLEFK